MKTAQYGKGYQKIQNGLNQLYKAEDQSLRFSYWIFTFVSESSDQILLLSAITSSRDVLVNIRRTEAVESVRSTGVVVTHLLRNILCIQDQSTSHIFGECNPNLVSKILRCCKALKLIYPVDLAPEGLHLDNVLV